ncbi:MAG: hypothetical protein H6744_08185 [Deltaproteobacteria bacterium]|nr:hypothetical protein [Deltaproteobacteria bacterium]MCB9786656.1 hypothetical protein [Deltaproteobacteria bacterium]
MRPGAPEAPPAAFAEALGQRVQAAGGRLLELAFEGGTLRARVACAPDADADPAAEGARLDAFFAPAHTDWRALAVGPELRFWYQRVGVEHGEGDGSEGVRALSAALCALVTEGGHAALSRQLDDRAYDARRVREAQLPWLVGHGYKPAAIVLVTPDEVRRDRWRSEVPHAVYSRFTIEETATGKILAGPEQAPAPRFLYCAQSAAAAELLRTLDDAILDDTGHDTATRERLRLEQGLLLGYPECCARRYAAAHATDSPWHELWLPLEAGLPAAAGHPLANYLLATMYGLALFAHVPCGPRCEATVAQNRRLLDAVFDARTAERLEAVLGLSAVMWPGGALWLFRAGETEGAALRVESVDTPPLPELIGPRYAARLRTPLLESREADRGIDALRLRRGRLEVRVAGGWRAVEDPERRRFRRRPEPRIALYRRGRDTR